MVKHGGESFFLPFLSCLTHTAQSLGHALPALCQARVGFGDVLLDLWPSLHTLRRRGSAFVRMLQGHYARVRLLHSVHVRRLVLGLHGPACGLVTFRRCEDLPVLVHTVSRRAWGRRLRGAEGEARVSACLRVAFPLWVQGRRPQTAVFEAQCPSPLSPLSRLPVGLTASPARLEVRMVRYSFSAGLFHSLLYAGLSRRSHTSASAVCFLVPPPRLTILRSAPTNP